MRARAEYLRVVGVRLGQVLVERGEQAPDVVRVGVIDVADDGHVRFARDVDESGERVGHALREVAVSALAERGDEQGVIEEGERRALTVFTPVASAFEEVADGERLKLEASEADDLLGALEISGAPE